MNEPQRVQFSIQWLLIVTAIVALLIAVPMQLGETGVLLLVIVGVLASLICIMYFVQKIAVAKQKLLPFWQATFAYVVFLPLMTGATSMWRDSDAIVASFIFGIGLMLSLVALLRGNWATRIYVAPIAIFYGNVIFSVISSAIRHKTFIWNYWMGPEF